MPHDSTDAYSIVLIQRGMDIPLLVFFLDLW
jgi:hypothetical protein